MNLNITTTIRNLAKNPVYSLITFTGFVLSIAAALYIYLWVNAELSYDKFHLDYHRIYRVLTVTEEGGQLVKSAGSYRPLAATLKSDYPQIENATFLSFSSEDSPLQVSDNSEKIEARQMWVNNDFFSIFNGFVFIEGEAFDAIGNPSGIILSEDVAKKLFGENRALGQEIIINKYNKMVYQVTGVVRIPKNSHLNFGYIITETNPEVGSYAKMWGDKGHTLVYIKLAKNAEITDDFLNNVTNHISRYNSRPDKLQFQPLADIHLHTNYEPSLYDKNISSYIYVWIFSFLAVMILLMASLNFSVLSVARASERYKEIGIKKVNGANRAGIIAQFMTESAIQTITATIAAVLLTAILTPWLNQISATGINFTPSFQLIVNLLAIALITSIMSGAYPSFYLSGLAPSKIIKGQGPVGTRAKFIRILVTSQFTITIFFLVASILFMRQISFIMNKDLGLKHDNIVVIPTGLWYNNKGFKDELLQNPNILAVSASVDVPIEIPWIFPIHYINNEVADTLTATLLWADEDFAETYDLQMVKGRFLQMDYSQYWEEIKKSRSKGTEDQSHSMSLPIVINETAARLIGTEDPIGHRLGNYEIVGVVRDFHYRSVHHPIGALIITNDPQSIQAVNVRISPENRAETLQYIRKVYQKHREERGFSYSFFDDRLRDAYSGEIRMKNITLAFTFIGIIISSLGVLGMAIFSINRRIKEIGIRKVNGATDVEILSLLNKDLLKWIAVAFFIATPLAWFAMNKWLQNFAYKTGLSWWIFALAGLIALGIALLTVSWQSLKAANKNPLEALRYE